MGISTISRQRGSHLLAELPPTRDIEGALPLVLAGQAVVAYDLPHSSIEFFQRIDKLGICCFMVAPIVSGSRCVGAIRVLETRPRKFSEHERSLLATIGALAGLAVRDALPRQMTLSG
jgi:GAF domain-containing protein